MKDEAERKPCDDIGKRQTNKWGKGMREEGIE
jgi:hypothetical protein